MVMSLSDWSGPAELHCVLVLVGVAHGVEDAHVRGGDDAEVEVGVLLNVRVLVALGSTTAPFWSR
jgi:hypothetical protein